MDAEPYRDSTQPGRKDIDGVEWWACDPYPTWYRWEAGQLFTDHARFPLDPQTELQRALKAEERAEQELATARKHVEIARQALGSTTPPNNRQSPKPCPNPPQRLYHGTGHPFEPGDVIVPGSEVGKGRGQWVWMLENPAESWANVRAEAGVGFVCEVEPIGEVQTCRGAYRAKSARVIAVVEQRKDADG